MPPSGDWEAEGSGVKVLATIKTVELSQKKGVNLTKTWGCRGESCKCGEDEPPGPTDGETVEEGSEEAQIVDEESGSEHEWKTVDKNSKDEQEWPTVEEIREMMRETSEREWKVSSGRRRNRKKSQKVAKEATGDRAHTKPGESAHA